MNLTADDKIFIREHRKWLTSLFTRQIESLKENIFDVPTEDKEQREAEIRFIRLLQSWLRDIQILSQDKKTRKPPSFV